MYREALEKGTEKWEKIAMWQSVLNEGDASAAQEINRLLNTDCSRCTYHSMWCYRRVLFKNNLCYRGSADSEMAYRVFLRHRYALHHN
jgi:hypothetical protein